MIRVKHKGSFKKIDKFLIRIVNADHLIVLNKYGQMGADALALATPTDSGDTAKSWDYVIEGGVNKTTIYWTNSHEHEGVSIALILQYGHGTGSGGYVQGRDFINPAIAPIFDKMAEEAWREVTKA